MGMNVRQKLAKGRCPKLPCKAPCKRGETCPHGRNAEPTITIQEFPATPTANTPMDGFVAFAYHSLYGDISDRIEWSTSKRRQRILGKGRAPKLTFTMTGTQTLFAKVINHFGVKASDSKTIIVMPS